MSMAVEQNQSMCFTALVSLKHVKPALSALTHLQNTVNPYYRPYETQTYSLHFTLWMTLIFTINSAKNNAIIAKEA